ncbi:Scr1 family TA system antitoxin-like transcriptional regulator [Micromonospora echinospora]|uniref:Scr1 family TA system antitoxin-like transcriptional regulator n=1 Tax=Micromonospora echinospora TaxID=1877 RepID=UPI00378CB99B
MADDMGSTVPRRQLGRALRELRTEAQMTLDGAADALHCSRQKMWRIESGLGSARALDVRALCELYGATPELSRALTALAHETRARGWWHSYVDAIPEWFELYVGLESAASSIRRFDEALIPGMLQTRAYAFAVYQHRHEVTEQERAPGRGTATTACPATSETASGTQNGGDPGRGSAAPHGRQRSDHG